MAFTSTHAGVDGLLRDKTRPSRVAPLLPPVAERVWRLTQNDPPGETTIGPALLACEAAAWSGFPVVGQFQVRVIEDREAVGSAKLGDRLVG